MDYESIECTWPGCPHVGTGEHRAYVVRFKSSKIAVEEQRHWLTVSGSSIGTIRARAKRFPRTRTGYRAARDHARDLAAGSDPYYPAVDASYAVDRVYDIAQGGGL